MKRFVQEVAWAARYRYISWTEPIVSFTTGAAILIVWSGLWSMPAVSWGWVLFTTVLGRGDEPMESRVRHGDIELDRWVSPRWPLSLVARQIGRIIAQFRVGLPLAIVAIILGNPLPSFRFLIGIVMAVLLSAIWSAIAIETLGAQNPSVWAPLRSVLALCFSGVFIPFDHLPAFWKVVALCTPFPYFGAIPGGMAIGVMEPLFFLTATAVAFIYGGMIGRISFSWLGQFDRWIAIMAELAQLGLAAGVLIVSQWDIPSQWLAWACVEAALGLSRGLFVGPSLWNQDYRQGGRIDTLLAHPGDPLFRLIRRHMRWESILIALIPMSMASIIDARAIIFVLGGVATVGGVWIAASAAAFWISLPSAGIGLLTSLFGLGRWPMAAFPSWLQRPWWPWWWLGAIPAAWIGGQAGHGVWLFPPLGCIILGSGIAFWKFSLAEWQRKGG